MCSKIGCLKWFAQPPNHLATLKEMSRPKSIGPWPLFSRPNLREEANSGPQLGIESVKFTSAGFLRLLILDSSITPIKPLGYTWINEYHICLSSNNHDVGVRSPLSDGARSACLLSLRLAPVPQAFHLWLQELCLHEPSSWAVVGRWFSLPSPKKTSLAKLLGFAQVMNILRFMPMPQMGNSLPHYFSPHKTLNPAQPREPQLPFSIPSTPLAQVTSSKINCRAASCCSSQQHGHKLWP